MIIPSRGYLNVLRKCLVWFCLWVYRRQLSVCNEINLRRLRFEDEIIGWDLMVLDLRAIHVHVTTSQINSVLQPPMSQMECNAGDWNFLKEY